jgi:hypothetical protein
MPLFLIRLVPWSLKLSHGVFPLYLEHVMKRLWFLKRVVISP